MVYVREDDMQESKGKDLAGTDDQKLDERKSEATMDKTLSDIEKSESASSSRASEHGLGPSPDGTLDDPDEVNDTGPM
jgi:hypothetical protein